MSNSVGVVVLDSYDTQPLKRAALWFDKLAIIDRRAVVPPRSDTERNALRGDLDYLKQRNIIYKLEDGWDEAPLGDDSEAQALEEERNALLMQPLLAPILGRAEMRAGLRRFWAVQARIASMWLRRTQGLDAVPILNSFSELEVPEASRKEQVIRVVLNALPMPSDTTPWERIIDFREDKPAQRTWERLRHWTTETARKDYDANEIETYLRSLLYDYEEAARTHVAHLRRGFFATIVFTPLEIAENLGEKLKKLQFSKIAESLFSINTMPLTLLQADPNVAGREVAYIAGAREAFGE